MTYTESTKLNVGDKVIAKLKTSDKKALLTVTGMDKSVGKFHLSDGSWREWWEMESIK